MKHVVTFCLLMSFSLFAADKAGKEPVKNSYFMSDLLSGVNGSDICNVLIGIGIVGMYVAEDCKINRKAILIGLLTGGFVYQQILINQYGNLIDEQGRLINQHANFINQHANFINQHTQAINASALKLSEVSKTVDGLNKKTTPNFFTKFISAYDLVVK